MLMASTLQLKRIFRIVNGSTPKSDNPDFWDGDISWATPEDVSSAKNGSLLSTKRAITHSGYDNSGTTLVPKASIILTTRAPIGNVALAGIELCTNQGCKSLVPLSSQVDPRYYYYQLLARSEDLQSLGNGTTFVELSTGNLGVFDLFAPNFESQIAIANFLDRETAKADALVVKYERLIELLEEKRTALVTQAVTKGLDPNVPMKDSGSEFLGLVPHHWEVLKSRVLFTLSNGFAFDGAFFSKTESNWPILVTPGNFSPEGGLYFTDDNTAHYGGVVPNGFLLQIGAQIIVMTDLSYKKLILGRCEDVWQEGLLLNQRIARIVPTKNKWGVHTNKRYLRYALNSRPLREQLISGTNGATVYHTSPQKIRSCAFPLPPPTEQERIADYLDDGCNGIAELIKACRSAIGLLREHRSALITAAVTGQIDVTTYKTAQVTSERASA